MWRAALKNLWAHKIRLGLTTLAVVLGVGFVAGTLILTDTLNRSFDNMFGDVYKNIAVEVRGQAHVDSDYASAASRDPVPASLADTLSKVPGVDQVNGGVGGYAQIVNPKTKKAISPMGAPTMGYGWIEGSKTGTSRIVTGHAPTSPGQVIVDQYTADKNDLPLGGSLQIVTNTGTVTATMVGTFQIGGSKSLGGATIVAFSQPTAIRLLGTPGQFESIDIAAAPGVSPAELRQRVAKVLPAGFEAVTGKQLADESSNDVQKGLSFLNIAMLVFAGISLFVGIFMIVNTFTMLMSQRARELALLRALGASRGQITRSVMLEALGTGVIASTIGVGFGYIVAILLYQLIGGSMLGLSGDTLIFRPSTVITSYIVGVLFTLGAAYLPAHRAAKVPPVAAMRRDVTTPPRSLAVRLRIGLALAAVGVASGLSGIAGVPKAAMFIGLGAAFILVAATVLSPFIAPPFVRLFGAPLRRMFGVPGALGSENALRSPRRTAATASALMIGVALVTGIGTLASSLVASTDKLIDKTVGADLIITPSNSMGNGGVPVASAEAIRRLPGVDRVTEFQGEQVDIDGHRPFLGGVSADGADRSLGLTAVSGNINQALADGQLVIGQDIADARKWTMGQRLPVTFSQTGKTTLTIGAIYEKSQLAGGYLIGLGELAKHTHNKLDEVVLVAVAQGNKVAAVKADVDKVLASYPTVTVRDQSEYKAEIRKQINQMLTFVFALLLLSIIIAILGIVNTLALSVFERTREIGLLRAVGLGRRQMAGTITLESLIIALYGAVLGIVIGIVLGWGLQRAMRDQGVDVLSLPYGIIASTFITSGIVGVLAALWPSRRATRMNMLKAIAAD